MKKKNIFYLFSLLFIGVSLSFLQGCKEEETPPPVPEQSKDNLVEYTSEYQNFPDSTVVTLTTNIYVHSILTKTEKYSYNLPNLGTKTERIESENSSGELIEKDTVVRIPYAISFHAKEVK